MDTKQMIAILEGLLFITGDDGVTERDIQEVVGLTPKKASNLIKLYAEYLNDELSRGLKLVEFDGIYKLATKAEHVQYYTKLVESPTRKNKLSQAALETLAIYAYKGPITRLEVEDIRGVSADAMTKKLEAMALIKEVGRTDQPGRPILYNVTPEFYDAFGVKTKDELPEIDAFIEEEREEDLFETNRPDK